MIFFLNRMKMYHNVSSFDKNYHKEYLKADIGLIFIKSFFRSDFLSNHQIIHWCDEPHNKWKLFWIWNIFIISWLTDLLFSLSHLWRLLLVIDLYRHSSVNNFTFLTSSLPEGQLLPFLVRSIFWILIRKFMT